MLLVRTYLAPSPIAGIGCFAAEPVKRGAVVWLYYTGLDLCLEPTDVEAVPAAAQEYIMSHGFFDHVGNIILSPDNSAYVNHSDDPNIRGDFISDTSIAVRDIAAGEEITEDYMTYGAGACRSFLDQR